MAYKDDKTKGFKLLAFNKKSLKLTCCHLFGELLNSSSFFQILPEGISALRHPSEGGHLG